MKVTAVYLTATVPNILGTWGLVLWKTVSPWTGVGVGGDGLGMIQTHYIYCALYFYYYYISSTSDH